jgi:serine/threonine protein kinase
MPPEAPERKTPLEKSALDPFPSPADAIQESAIGGSTESPLSDNVQTPSSRQTTAGLPTPHVPDHELIRRIGAGSYGEVWLARSIVGSYRAVKVVYRTTFESERPFEREFIGIQKFEPVSRTHEGLMDVLQIGRNDAAGYFYYVMELADDGSEGRLQPATGFHQPIEQNSARSDRLKPGLQTYVPRTLGEEIRRQGRLPLKECVQIGLSTTSALAHLHGHGLVHRDIKPSNIIFVNGLPRLADIGLVAHMSEARSFVGTEGFIPPEGPGTAQADLYSLGKVIYEISTGKDRHDFPDLPDDLKDSSQRAGLAELNEIVLKACAGDLGLRYRSAEEMHADLRVLEMGASVKRKHSMARRWAVARKIAFAVAALAVLHLSLLLIQQQSGRERAIKPAALGLYTDAWGLVRKGRKQDLETAAVKLEQALLLDPDPRIYAALALAYGEKAFFFEPANQELDSLAEGAVDKARLLGATLPETLFTRGYLLWLRPHNKGWRHKEAIEAFQRLLDLHPNLATENPELAAETHQQLASIYLHVGLLDEALQEAQVAAVLEPLHSRVQYLMGVVSLHRGEFPEAVDRLRRVISMEVGLNYADLALALLKQGLTNEARATIQEGLEKQPTDPGGQYASVEAMLAARAGQLAQAEEWIRAAEEKGKGYGHFHHTAYNIACAYAILNKPQPAVDWLQRAFTTGFACYPAFKNDPTFENIRRDPGFEKFLEQQKELCTGYQDFHRQLVANTRR